MKDLLDEMYIDPNNIQSEWIEKLFPSDAEGCINFGYWKNIRAPLNISKRIQSQKNLYFEIFKHLSPSCKKLLEVGCGRGHGTFWLRSMGYQAFGIDILENQIKKAKNNYFSLSKFLKVGAAEAIPFKNSNFDCVYSLEAAQHFLSFNDFCAESFRVLKTNGKLIISTYFLNDNKFSKNLEKIIPSNLEGFHNALSLDEAIHLMKANGFIIKKSLPIGRYVFPKYAAWHKMQLANTSLSSLSSERMRWKDYYTGGGHEHPWQRAFKNGWIDYLILEAIKVKE